MTTALHLQDRAALRIRGQVTMVGSTDMLNGGAANRETRRNP